MPAERQAAASGPGTTKRPRNEEGPRRSEALPQFLPLSRALRDRVLDGPAGELGAPAQAGLLADAREVVLHRAR